MSGAILTVSTSRAMLPISSASGMEFMPAQARMETEAMLRSLLRHVDHIELGGAPELALNNVIRRFETLPLHLVPKGSRYPRE
jgi:hypothetical protein